VEPMATRSKDIITKSQDVLSHRHRRSTIPTTRTNTNNITKIWAWECTESAHLHLFLKTKNSHMYYNLYRLHPPTSARLVEPSRCGLISHSEKKSLSPKERSPFHVRPRRHKHSDFCHKFSALATSCFDFFIVEVISGSPNRNRNRKFVFFLSFSSETAL